MRQITLFDVEINGDLLRAAGQELVLIHEKAEYKAAYVAAVTALRTGTRFTSETITAIVGQPPHNPNSVGALTSACATLGLCRATGRHVKARRPNQHGAEIKVWRRT